jgi:amino acid transporter
LILNAVIFFDPSFEPKAWHSFLLYLAYTLVAFLINTFMSRILHIITKAAFIWSLTGFVVICITVLACAAPNYQSGAMVYTHFTNNTGWPDGLAWLLGLLQGALGVTGFDAVAHMIEEIPHPSHTAPRIIIICVAIGLATGFVFLSVLLFVLKDLDYVVSSPNGPLLQIFYDATNSKAGSVCLLIFPLVCIMFGSISISATSRRMIYAFARDGGLPFSHVFAKVHTGLDVPLNALYLTNALVVAFGCVLLGSSSAMNAIVSASVVALGVSYAMPVAVNMLRGRKALPEDRPFKIPEPWGWILNLVRRITSLYFRS